ncbi:MAG: ATP-binding cassette domain-containing protein [Anaerolineae bacterium]|nr:ATP-binding cassette domain-containing protein [Anaerolineae bacterium]NIN97231.1 ATP-binding cassette domain-containing protein [Anaerolineae bacterium]NIQ80183.1 ATP-binding cassette domain-containing protein [Anaerolineae bacterium]
MTETAVRMENLRREFGPVKALDGISLEVPAGMIYGFLGPNGAGKTTTINLLLGLLEPTEGRAEVLGFNTSTQGDEVRARTGALLEHTGLYEQLSAEDNLEFYGRVWRMPAAERRARIEELLSHMGVWERRKDWVGKWSKGMKKKLALARAMLHRPELIFLDEPTAGLDVVAAATVRDDLAALAAREGVTVFLTTHNMAEAERLCGQVAVIREGRLVAVGAPDELRARSGGPRVEIFGRGFTDGALEMLRARPEVAAAEVENRHLLIDLGTEMDIAPLITLLVSAGVQVEEVRRGKASLEEVFLTLMEEDR